MMLYVFFLLYVALGLSVSAVFFVWAVKNRQFAGQSRAAYLPLEGERPLAEPCPWARRWTPAVWGTLSIVAVSAVLFGAALVVLLSGCRA
ncbi:MAG: hypothetical protein ACYTFG_14555 [Planctomycetota bacterium]|jgi:cbb3-type cytochrome oxidase maturation protein